MKKIFIFLSLIICFPFMASVALTSDKVGEVMAVKGKANIIRADKKMDAGRKDGILLADTVTTGKDSRLKLLFIDDSLLTLGENSKLSIKEHLTGDDRKRGRSIFSLVDGRVRAIVGKNRFEIHTPTAVAAARGTVLIVWLTRTDGVPTTCNAVLKGMIDTSNIKESIKGIEPVREGYMNCVSDGPPTKPVPIPKELLDELIESTSVDEDADTETPQGGPTDEGDEGGEFPGLPPIEQQPIIPSYGGYG
ncbi:MAG: FecR family protein [Nitrospirota bacterium]